MKRGCRFSWLLVVVELMGSTLSELSSTRRKNVGGSVRENSLSVFFFFFVCVCVCVSECVCECVHNCVK